jgi:hypothetical protein
LDDFASDLAVLIGLENGTRIECPPFTLQRGWNSVSFDLPAAANVGPTALRTRKLWVTFTGDAVDQLRSVVIDNVRAWANDSTATGVCVFFSHWRSPLIWGTWDETTHPAGEVSRIIPDRNALKFHFDLRKYGRPSLYTEFRPVWDLSKIREIVLDLFVDKVLEVRSLRLALTGALETCESPLLHLKTGRNRLRIKLDWLPSAVGCNVRRMEWFVSGSGNGQGWISIDRMKAGGPDSSSLT